MYERAKKGITEKQKKGEGKKKRQETPSNIFPAKRLCKNERKKEKENINKKVMIE